MNRGKPELRSNILKIFNQFETKFWPCISSALDFLRDDMKKEDKRKKQTKNLAKKVLIGLGIAGISIWTIRTIIRGRQKNNECQSMRVAHNQSLKTIEIPVETIETPVETGKHTADSNDDAVVRKCNKLLKKLWKSGNPDNKFYYDDDVYIDIKQCPFPPYITPLESEW